MRQLGRFSFIILLPLLRIYLKRTTRVYALVVYGGEVLVVKGWLGRQNWQLPGGGVRRGEKSPQAIIRELKEEVGLVIDEPEAGPLTSGRWYTDRLGYEYRIYLFKLDKKHQPDILWPELVDAVWLKPSRLSSSNCPSEILEALTKADLL